MLLADDISCSLYRFSFISGRDRKLKSYGYGSNRIRMRYDKKSFLRRDRQEQVRRAPDRIQAQRERVRRASLGRRELYMPYERWKDSVNR